ncbi:ADP-ribose pyrophosphatase [Candidatus Izimaplasma bacterium HR1]|jgi:ADP-ribose pyrophosphatase|uniref:NUDIX domain-containing protein n=1 Tax=Candidatus Izimoplasma sp. HR1 TaxID=1541959 RepID=UPI0004F844D9|nr:ADP-ribose pyrophosphatase [Candidatus Izimaplasma bacterium HR1]
MKLIEKKLDSKKLYECFFMTLYEDKVLLPNDKTSTRIYIKHDGASAVLPITKEGKLVLIKQYRYPISGVSIEIPAGKKDEKHEDGLVCALRELEEETGYTSNNVVKFQDFHSCVGYSSEMIELFIAHDCVKLENPKSGDDDEFIELLEVTKTEAKTLVNSGKITDSKTLAVLLYYLYGDNNE